MAAMIARVSSMVGSVAAMPARLVAMRIVTGMRSGVAVVVERVRECVVGVDARMAVQMFGSVKGARMLVVSAGEAAFHFSVKRMTPSVAMDMGLAVHVGGGVAVFGMSLPLITASCLEIPSGLLGRATEGGWFQG